jgi:biopolymer transport protein ExbD
MPLKLHQDELPNLNLTSLIDVLFLLIMFFMVATKFDEYERNIDVSVPEVAEAGDAATPPEPMVVSVLADGHVELDGQVVTLAELTTQLSAAHRQLSEPTVVIRGDAKCAFQNIAAALAACRQANISELGISVRIAATSGDATVR